MTITKNTGRQWPLVATSLITAAELDTIALHEAVDLPGNAKITGGELEVVTVDAGGGTVAVKLGSVTLLAATSSATATRNAFTETGATTTAPTTVDVTLAAFVLTTGVYRLTVEYVLHDRANEVQPVAAV
jgi:hypothetical protein